MGPASYMVSARYHMRWYVKYSAAALVCFALSLYAWPTNAGLVAVWVGYVFTWLARRARKRARVVLP